MMISGPESGSAVVTNWGKIVAMRRKSNIPNGVDVTFIDHDASPRL